MFAPSSLFPPHRTLKGPWWGWWCAYIVAFVWVDWVSYIRPLHGLNITPWNPPAALAVALLVSDRRGWPAVWLALVAAEWLVRDVPFDAWAVLVATAGLTTAYLAVAGLMSHQRDRLLVLATRRDLMIFMAIVAAGALLDSLAYVGGFALIGGGRVDEDLPVAVARYWVGDAVGLIVVLPLLRVLQDPLRRQALMSMARSAAWWLTVVGIVGLLWLVFGRGTHDQFKFFYWLLLPAIWAAGRWGLVGAVGASGITQVGLIALLQGGLHSDLTVFELQALMAAVTMTSLMLGVTVDERARVAAELRSSLRMAAAGQMASALAHELSQPLTALSSYSQALRLLVDAPGPWDESRRRRVETVAQKVADDAHRAGDVVRRLRDFFLTGSTRLCPTPPASVLNEAAASQVRRAESLGVDLRVQVPADLPEVWMDPVQIGVVLRNLLANALEAAGQGGWVRLHAAATVEGLQVEVADSGPGLSLQRLQSLFDPQASDKPGGMGIGLGISRAIVQAHGGRLWAEPGPGGRLRFTLPVDAAGTLEGGDAP